MKKSCILFFLLHVSLTIFAENIDWSSCFFSYPFKSGDAEWVKFSSAKERIAALQIPEDILTRITTEDLLNICLDFPYLSDILLYDNSTKGFSSVVNEFNGFRELLKRYDLTIELLRLFKDIPLSSNRVDIKDFDSVGKFSLRTYVLTFMLSTNSIIEKMSTVQKQETLQYARENYNEISNNPKAFGTLSLLPLRQLIDTLEGYSLTSDMLERSFTTRYTPNGTSVAAVIVPNEMSDEEKLYLKNLVINNYGVIFVSEATLKYNCHAYAWHMTEGNANDKVWINEPDAYWEDGSYIEVPESIASKVSYQNDHSAVRIR